METIRTTPEITEQSEAERVLEEARAEIDRIDQERLSLLVRRLELATMAGEAKRVLGRPVYNGQRENDVIKRYTDHAEQQGVPRDLALNDIVSTVTACRNLQMQPL